MWVGEDGDQGLSIDEVDDSGDRITELETDEFLCGCFPSIILATLFCCSAGFLRISAILLHVRPHNKSSSAS